MAELEARVEKKESELNELRSRMTRLREDFQYNLNLLDERDSELERYDVLSARAASDAAVAAQRLREEHLATSEAVSEAKRWQQRAAELEAHHVQRTAEMREALQGERLAREEALFRQQEEFDSHKRTLMRQISERDKLLETQRSDLLDAAAEEVRRARDKTIVKSEGDVAMAAGQEVKISSLERQVATLRERARLSEEEAVAARSAREQLEVSLKTATKEYGANMRQKEALIAELEEKYASAERKAARGAEDAEAASSAAAAAVNLAEAAAEDIRNEAAAFQLRRDAEHAAECAALSTRSDVLLRRAEVAERAVEETRAAAAVSRRELEERLVETIENAATAEQRHESRKALDVDKTENEKRQILKQLDLSRKDLAAAQQREVSLRTMMDEHLKELSSVKAQFAASQERAHMDSRATVNSKLQADVALEGKESAALMEAAETNRMLKMKCKYLEERLIKAEGSVNTAVSAQNASEAELEITRRCLSVRSVASQDVMVLADLFDVSTRRESDVELKQLSQGEDLARENVRLRSSIEAMRMEMETLQQSFFDPSNRMVTSSSPETTRGNSTSLAQKFQDIPPHDVNSTGGRGSVPEFGVSPKDLIVELELARSEVRRLTLDKERLLEMSNTLRAELEFSTRATSEGAESEGDKVDTVALKHKSVFASVGLTMSGSQIQKSSVERVFNKASERSTTSQKAQLKSTQQNVLQRRAVRNWNVRGDGDETVMG
jgi:hypothetical protein